jgi:hypothetical protein
MFKGALEDVLDSVRLTPLLEASEPLRMLRRVDNEEQLGLVVRNWVRTLAQPYGFDRKSDYQYLVCTLRNPDAFLPQYRKANKALFSFNNKITRVAFDSLKP